MPNSVSPGRDIQTPSSLNRWVRDLLHETLPPLWLEGEISNLARPASGHMYFALKDDKAQIRCALFRRSGRRLAFRPENGMQVQVHGRVSLYEARGDYQMIVEDMQEAGEGALQRQFEQLKRRLEAEGLFAAERKRPLPAWPRRIGILSSPSGAAVRDVISVIRRRMPLAEVELMPVPVQGKDAPAAIHAMLQRAQQAARHDVLVLTRGGGSLEDLWAFNDEALARLIAASPVPVLSAVGHEIDFTLADFAADVRAATPSVAGELLVPDREPLTRQLQHQAARLHQRMDYEITSRAQAVDRHHARLQQQHPTRRLERGREQLQSLHHRLQRSLPLEPLGDRVAALQRHLVPARLQQRLERIRHQQQQLAARLQHGQQHQLQQARSSSQALRRALYAVSPLATLERGYAIVFDADGRTLRSVAAVPENAKLRIRLADGEMSARRTIDN